MVNVRRKIDYIIKKPGEISKITKAVHYTEKAMKYALSVFELGMSEKELAKKIRGWASEHGLKVGFCLIQGDSNTASIHGKPTNHKIRKILLIDLGLIYKGYFGDITRTYLLTPDKKMKKVYSIVKKAHEMAISKVKLGMPCKAIDSVVRKKIIKHDYKFLHSTGHGVGMCVHEYPKISQKSDDIFQRGMVFTIEPGIYLKGSFGVRIEDVFVMKNKIQKLSKIKIPDYD